MIMSEIIEGASGDYLEVTTYTGADAARNGKTERVGIRLLSPDGRILKCGITLDKGIAAALAKELLRAAGRIAAAQAEAKESTHA